MAKIWAISYGVITTRDTNERMNIGQKIRVLACQLHVLMHSIWGDMSKSNRYMGSDAILTSNWLTLTHGMAPTVLGSKTGHSLYIYKNTP